VVRIVLLPIVSFSADAAVAATYFIRQTLGAYFRFSSPLPPERLAQARAIDMRMGWTMWGTLSVENATCRIQTGDLLLLLLGWGAVAGGLGSLRSLTRFSARPCKGRNTQTRDAY